MEIITIFNALIGILNLFLHLSGFFGRFKLATCVSQAEKTNEVVAKLSFDEISLLLNAINESIIEASKT